jgi:hypothetical protein
MSEKKWETRKWVLLSALAMLATVLLVFLGVGGDRYFQPAPGSHFVAADFANLKPGDRLIDKNGQKWTINSPLYVMDWSMYGAKPKHEKYFDVGSMYGHEVRVTVPDLVRSTKQVIRQ